VKVNKDLVNFAKQYRLVLRRQFKPDRQVSRLATERLGRQALAMGLETLDVARVHARALAQLPAREQPIGVRARQLARAREFFAEVMVPIEKTHPPAVQSDLRIRQLARTLQQREAQTSATARRLSDGIARRQAAEDHLKQSGTRRAALLTEARRLQERLRDQTRNLLAAQENERRRSSQRLRNEVAQILLAIDIRLFNLKRATWADTEVLKKEIVDAQRLVKQSAKAVRRFKDAIGAPHEA
jgi:hypothetical protein